MKSLLFWTLSLFLSCCSIHASAIGIETVHTEEHQISLRVNQGIWRVRVPSPHQELHIKLKVPDGFDNVRVRLFKIDDSMKPSSGKHRITYRGLKSGYYIFLIEAEDSQKKLHQTVAHFRLQSPSRVFKYQNSLTRGAIIASAFLILIWLLFRLSRRGKKREQTARLLLSSTEKERSRIAADLHDGIGQSLLVIKNSATLAQRSDPESKLAQPLQQITETASEALKETRTIVRNLRPPELDRLGLEKALEAMGQRFATGSDLSIHCEILCDLERLPEEKHIEIFRILQEALNNAVKHADAKKISISARQERKLFIAEVQDDGKGIPPLADQTGGTGCQTMQERALLLGGVLKTVTPATGGTLIRLEISC